MTPERQALLSRMAQCEQEGRFDVHTLPPELSLSLPVDEGYDYLRNTPKHFFKQLFASFLYLFVEFDVTVPLLALKVEGKEKLRAAPRSVIVSNHVHMFDCVAIRHVYHNRQVYTLAAEFNNRGDFLGYMMRYSGMLPLSSNRQAMRNLNEAIDTILHRKQGHLLVFPEASEWLYYEKPRPFKPGAFHYAVEHGVPVQPMFFTFSCPERADKKGDPKPKATLHIGDALYPDPTLSKREQREALAAAAYAFMKDTYEKAYGIALVYACDEQKP